MESLISWFLNASISEVASYACLVAGALCIVYLALMGDEE